VKGGDGSVVEEPGGIFFQAKRKRIMGVDRLPILKKKNTSTERGLAPVRFSALKKRRQQSVGNGSGA